MSNKKFIYEAKFRVDIGKAVKSVGDFMDEINSHLSTMGYDGKIKATADIFTIEVGANRELTKKEQEIVKNILAKQSKDLFSDYSIDLASFGRKSGNTLPSAS